MQLGVINSKITILILQKLRYANDYVVNFFSIDILASIIGLLLALLLPLVIMLLEGGSNHWDRAVILNKVIHFKSLVVSIFIISIILLLWRIHTLEFIFIIFYFLSFYLICRTLYLSVKWLSDWAESFEGVRFKWRKNILTNKKLKPQEKIKIWENVFEQLNDDFGSSRGQNTIFSFNEYEENYDSLNSEDISIQARFASILLENLDVFLSTYRESNQFWECAINNFLENSQNNQKYKLTRLWKNIVIEAMKITAQDEYGVYILLEELKKIKSRLKDGKLKTFMNFIPDQIIELFYLRNNELEDYDLFNNTEWIIVSDDLRSQEKEKPQAYLLKAFFKKVNNIAANSENSIKLQRLVNVIFKKADPICLGRSYNLLHNYYIPKVEDEELAYSILAKPLKFGNVSRLTGTDDNGDIGQYMDEYQKEFEESIKITVFYFRSFLKSEFGKEYLKKMKLGLQSTKLEKLLEEQNRKDLEVLAVVYLDLIEKIEAELIK
ncbi:hypothetical protein LB941_08305 [Ligilactobacillus sp. WILCCON 0076]|uniref:Uncharacterized protein n=1 Tax=Ligilactobacillus ubinensis TaxID=2876789 RepID=A0A9X2FLB8_9LACO|nr:hypothetical protein [Ligilactobacillus ubinensis]MCP0887334.1 hypothetical protein [Ligilactobacillus ubinensis]